MLGYWPFRGKLLLVPLGIFLLAYLFQIPEQAFADSFPMAVLYVLCFADRDLGSVFAGLCFCAGGKEMKKKKNFGFEY